MGRGAVDQLTLILDQEHDALMQGDLEHVASLIEKKQQLVTRFENGNFDALEALSFKLNRNGRLLAAAKAGVGEALSTMKKLNASRTSLSSYDRSGRATQIRPTKSSTDHRF